MAAFAIFFLLLTFAHALFPWPAKTLYESPSESRLVVATAYLYVALTLLPFWVLVAFQIPPRGCVSMLGCACARDGFNHRFVDWLEAKILFVPYEVAVIGTGALITFSTLIALRKWRLRLFRERTAEAVSAPQIYLALEDTLE